MCKNLGTEMEAEEEEGIGKGNVLIKILRCLL